MQNDLSSFNGRGLLHLQGSRPHRMVRWVWKWCKSYVFTVTRSQPNSSEVKSGQHLWEVLDVLESTLYNQSQQSRPTEEKYFERKVLHLFIHWSCSGGPWWSAIIQHVSCYFLSFSLCACDTCQDLPNKSHSDVWCSICNKYSHHTAITPFHLPASALVGLPLHIMELFS